MRWLIVPALLFIGYLLPPLIHSSYHYQFSYNEGWNAYNASNLAQGRRLYGQMPVYTIVNYPPLSYYLVNAAAPIAGDTLMAGRLIAWLALFGIALLSGIIVWRMAQSAPAGVFAGLLAPVALARYAPPYIGIDDPQFAGLAALLLGVAFFVWSPSNRFTVLSAITIATALFVKHSMLVFPAAIGLVLLIQNQRRFAIWLSALVATAGLLLGFSVLVQGPYFLASILAPRTFRNIRAPEALMIFASAMQLPLAAAIVWLLLDRRHRWWPLLAGAFGLGLAYGLFASRATGVSFNIWFDLLIVTCLICGLAWSRLRLLWNLNGWPHAWVAGLGPMLLCLGFASQEMLPRGIMFLRDSKTEWAAAEAQFKSDAAYVRSQPGPAICEDLALCWTAGKPLDYECFNAAEHIATKPGSEGAIVQALQDRRYKVIEFDVEENQPITAAARARFPQPFMQALLANYHADRRNGQRAFFVPN